MSVALRLLTLHLKKDKDVPCLVLPHLEIKTGMNRSRLEEKKKVMNHQVVLSAPQITRWEEERK